MSDLNNFISLYKSFGINCKVKNNLSNGYNYVVFHDGDDDSTWSDKFSGCKNIYTIIVFDIDGKFLWQEFWI
jgi:hypothetical protein